MALISSSRNAAISRSRLSSGADDCSSVMKRTTRSAVSRWQATFNVSQCCDPDTTWIAWAQLSAASALVVIEAMSL